MRREWLAAGLVALLAASSAAQEPAAAPAAAAAAETPAAEEGGSLASAKLDADAAQVREALELETREAALRVLEQEIDGKLGELRALREETNALVQQGGCPAVGAESQPSVETLIAFYQAMKPKNAATLLERLPLELAARVLGKMKTREAGRILNAMEPSRAVLISKRMAGESG